MELTHLPCLINVEKSTEKLNQPFFLLFALVPVLLQRFLITVKAIDNFFSRFWSFSLIELGSPIPETGDEKNEKFELGSRQPCISEMKDDLSVSREEVETLMRGLTLFGSPEGEELPQKLGASELSQLFDEKEPSLEEVKEAFDVFDENKDGFIDAGELQRVLIILGFKEGSKMENCTKMIQRYDGNGDGKIDFKEFVKFMENSFE